MIKESAFAKLNLNLQIIPERSIFGYWPVHFLDCQINLKDKLYFEKQKNKIEIVCENPQVPRGKNNFIYQAAEKLKKISGRQNLGCKIILKKNIPIKAGFGGGSSDAASALKGLLKLWQIKLKKNQLSDFVSQLGKDFYYSYYGGLCEIGGENNHYQIVSLPYKLPQFQLLIIVPDKKKPSTAFMYQNLKLETLGKNSDTFEKLKKAVKLDLKSEILKNLFNDFEQSAVLFYPQLAEIKKDMIKTGALKTLLAGSGLSMVGFFDNKKAVKKAAQLLKDKYSNILISKIIN